ncbi:hypothetical protein AMS68_005027 [Peltaster fructicola]|uniref:Methyltransferase domain-containing protein n=1 Tax=Peltaster fructicola TaxID=286661 RepID=A0A6H0XYL6_9PEZI|nr:hypothetical protein AMS68_005027 [Peltaster fructicola]
MSTKQDSDVTRPAGWDEISERYQGLVGRMTLHGTTRIVEYVNTVAPFQEDSYVLDVGAGGGSVEIVIRERAPAGTKILATDIAVGMLAQIDALKLPNVTTQQEDAVNLAGLKNDTFTHAFTTYAIQFTPDAQEAVNQMYRVLKPGGTAGILIWGDYVGMADIHDRACRLVNPQYRAAEPMAGKAWSGRVEHRQALMKAGFQNVEINGCLMPWYTETGEDFARYWFDFKNPVPELMLAGAAKQGITREQLRPVVTKLVNDEYSGPRGIVGTAVLGWGTK